MFRKKHLTFSILSPGDNDEIEGKESSDNNEGETETTGHRGHSSENLLREGLNPWSLQCI